jgi:hypothetical protein
MDRKKLFKPVVDDFLERTLGSAEQDVDNYRRPFQMMGLIKSPDDIEAAIIETFAAFKRVRKKKDQFDSQRLWSLFGFALMMTGIVTAKSLMPTIGFFCGSIIAMIFFSKAQKLSSPLTIEINAYEGVLLKLHEMKIMHEQVRGVSG